MVDRPRLHSAVERLDRYVATAIADGVDGVVGDGYSTNEAYGDVVQAARQYLKQPSKKLAADIMYRLGYASGLSSVSQYAPEGPDGDSPDQEIQEEIERDL